MRTANELLELAWGIIANAGGGNWDKESLEWDIAAGKWRDDYFAYMRQQQGLPEKKPDDLNITDPSGKLS